MPKEKIEIYSMGEVSRMLGVHSYQIDYLYRMGRINEPLYRLAGRRVFTRDDIILLAHEFGKRAPDLEDKAKRQLPTTADGDMYGGTLDTDIIVEISDSTEEKS